jgi:hypothetical protein
MSHLPVLRFRLDSTPIQKPPLQLHNHRLYLNSRHTPPRNSISDNKAFTTDMDDMDELNRLADNAESLSHTTPSMTEAEVEHWTNLFSYTPAEVSLLLNLQLADVTRERIPDAHWELIRDDVSAAGHSRVSWEHLLGMKDTMKANSMTLIDNCGKRWTLLRMVGFIRDKESVKKITGMEEDPKVTDVKAFDGSQKVVWVDDVGLKKIEDSIDAKLVLEKKGS